jgi:transketolase
VCIGAYEKLQAEGIAARVVSMPSWELFERQSAEYREQVLPTAITARVAIEAGTNLGWHQYVGNTGKTITRTDFGASAPAKDLFQHFGFTIDNLVTQAKSLLKK